MQRHLEEKKRSRTKNFKSITRRFELKIYNILQLLHGRTEILTEE